MSSLPSKLKITATPPVKEEKKKPEVIVLDDVESSTTNDCPSLWGPCFQKIEQDASCKRGLKELSRTSKKSNSNGSHNDSFSRKAILGQQSKAFLRIAALATSTAGGGLTSAVLLDPSGCSDWSQYAALYDEFRVHAVTVEWHPYKKYDTTLFGQVIFAFDNDSVATGTYDQTLQYGTAITGERSEFLKRHYKRPGMTASAYWNDCASPSGSTGAVIFAMSNGPNALAVGLVVTEYEIEFRSRR